MTQKRINPLEKASIRTGLLLLLMMLVFLSLHRVSFGQVADCCPGLEDNRWVRETLKPGIEHYQGYFEALFDAPQHINILTVDLKEPDAQIHLAAAKLFGEDRMTVSEIGNKTKSLAAINAGFAHGGKVNSGIIKIDGNVLPFLKQEPEELRFVGSSAVGMDSLGGWHFTDRKGEKWENDWEEVDNAIAGGHRLIRDGMINKTIDYEEYISAREIRHAGQRHPRTGFGMTSDSLIVLITVDGRFNVAEGVTLREFALLMNSLGCNDAINLDGGGSTTMWIRRKGVVNHPSDNGQYDSEGERLIRTAIYMN